MSLQPNATNNAAASAYFYTKEEINTAVQIAISSIGNLSTSALFTNLTVSSITVNPSGSINGAGTISTATLLANNGTVTNLTAPTATIAGGAFGLSSAFGANYTAIAPSNGFLRIAPGLNSQSGLNISPTSISFQQQGTGTTYTLATADTGPGTFPGISLQNVSSINGANITTFANNSSFTTASISSATISSINGSQITPNNGAFQAHNLTGLIPAVISGSNNPVIISSIQTGLGAGTYLANVNFWVNSWSTPQNSLTLNLGVAGGLNAGNTIMTMMEPNTFGGSPGYAQFTKSAGYLSSNGVIPVAYSYLASGVSCSNAFGAGGAPSVILQLFKVA